MATDPRYLTKWRNEVSRLDLNTTANKPVQLCRGAANDSRLHALSIVSTDTAANTVRLFLGQSVTKIGAATTGNLDFNSSTTSVSRTSGSFIADGWRVGDEVIIPAFRSVVTGNMFIGTVSIISAVAAGALTFTAAHGVSASSFSPSQFPDLELYRGIQLGLSSLVANQGNLGSNVSLDLLTDTKPFVDSSPDRFLVLGPNDALFLTCGTTLTTTETIEILAALGDY